MVVSTESCNRMIGMARVLELGMVDPKFANASACLLLSLGICVNLNSLNDFDIEVAIV